MAPLYILALVGLYFLVLIGISYLTGRRSDNATFFLANRRSPWYVVAFGMVGASLSGVTFISVPGWTEASQFSYLQVVLGYVAGYLVIIKVLLPLYYRLSLTSIYSYLEERFGPVSYRTGALFFMLSRIIGAAFRLYLVALVLHLAVFEPLNWPFWSTVALTILLIWVYTFRSGLKTIIWTDTLQTTFMLLAVIITIVYIQQQLLPQGDLLGYIAQQPSSQIFFWDSWRSEQYFWKNFLSGAFITIVMTGLDQDMMQKNLSCRNLKDAQKNMFSLSLVLVVVNLIFLSLGVLLYDYAAIKGIAFDSPDALFPAVALSGELGQTVIVFFVLGLIAAAYSSADSALTSLTTSFSIDILGLEAEGGTRGFGGLSAKSTRVLVHAAFSILLLGVILVFRQLNDDSVIKELFTAAGYTYGPLLGLYAFGLFTRWPVRDALVPLVAVIAPLLSFIVKQNAPQWFGYTMSFEHLILNGLLTFLGLWLLRQKGTPETPH